MWTLQRLPTHNGHLEACIEETSADSKTSLSSARKRDSHLLRNVDQWSTRMKWATSAVHFIVLGSHFALSKRLQVCLQIQNPSWLSWSKADSDSKPLISQVTFIRTRIRIMATLLHKKRKLTKHWGGKNYVLLLSHTAFQAKKFLKIQKRISASWHLRETRSLAWGQEHQGRRMKR